MQVVTLARIDTYYVSMVFIASGDNTNKGISKLLTAVPNVIIKLPPFYSAVPTFGAQMYMRYEYSIACVTNNTIIPSILFIFVEQQKQRNTAC